MEDIIGKKFGRLMVLEKTKLTMKNDRHKLYRCQCSCGGEKLARKQDLKRGHISSCGCLPQKKKFVPNEIVEKSDYIVMLIKSEKCLVDKEDYEKVKKYRWHLNNKGYVVTNIGKKKLLMHHVVLEKQIGFDVDHINHNKLDNRKTI